MYMLETIAIHECENSMSEYLSLIPMTTVPCSHKDATLESLMRIPIEGLLLSLLLPYEY